MEQEFLDFLKELEQSNETWRSELETRLTNLENLLVNSNQSAIQAHSDKDYVKSSAERLTNNQLALENRLKSLIERLGNYESQQKQIDQNAKEISSILGILEALKG